MEFISKKQQAIINFIDKFSFEFQYPPSIREIGAAMGHQSISTTHGFIGRLEKKNLLSWKRHQPRTIVLTRKGMNQVTKARASEIIVQAEELA
ncbi:LexA family protein [Paenibacillus sp. FSL K6-2859]|uniref:LexA family protein n=1 Tax=Paenibacillus sp. FSL K6-2859 TaxID=2921482 RepID=UPI0030FC1D68